jgi:hypothetical protein
MRNVLKEFSLESQPNMVEEDQVLMDLAHVADVRHDRKVKDLREEADRQELADAGDSGAVNLDK